MSDRPLRVQFDVTHPAHVHLFKHAIEELQAAGHETLVTSREKEVTTDLLDAYDIDHRPVSREYGSKLLLAPEFLLRELRLTRIARRFRPDVVLSHINPAAVHAARLVGAESVVFLDDEAALSVLGRVVRPFGPTICTPAGFKPDLGEHHRRYEGFHELAYLHPDRFEFDPDLLRAHGVAPDDPYFVLRFVSWGAHHDVGEAGFSRAAKRELVEHLGDRGTVYVSAEGSVPPEFEARTVPVPPEHIHHLLAGADLYAGDSQTMAIEAGLLGTPSVRSNSFAAAGEMGHFEELESEYGLVLSIGDEREAVRTIKGLVDDPQAGERWQARRERLLADKIDVTEYVLDRIYEGAGRERERRRDQRRVST